MHVYRSLEQAYLHQGCEGRADVVEPCCFHVSHPVMQELRAFLPMRVPVVLVQPVSPSRLHWRASRLRLILDGLHNE